MSQRFNPPPGWPPSPAGWTPPADWRSDPSWPPAPPGWQFWIPEESLAGRAPDVACPALGASVRCARAVGLAGA